MAEFHVHNRHVTLRWDVSRVAFGAIAAAAKLLDGCDEDAIVTLEYFWGAWATERDLAPSFALDRLLETIAFADVSPFLGTNVVPRDASSVRSEGGLITQTFEFWDRNGGFWRDGPDEPGLDIIGERILGMQHDFADSELVISHIGDKSSAAQVFGPAFADDAVGRRPTRSQPDYEFDERVCDVYDDVMASGDIRVDHVLAYIRRPEKEPVWVPYRRLLVRTEDRGGKPTLMSMVEMRPDIAIPFMRA